MKFLIVEPSPLPILIPLGPKYSPQDPVFKRWTKHELKLSLKVSADPIHRATEYYIRPTHDSEVELIDHKSFTLYNHFTAFLMSPGQLKPY